MIKRIFLLMGLILALGATGTMAQTANTQEAVTKEQRRMLKQERKAVQAQIDSMLAAEARQAIADTAFTLEADQVAFKDGSIAYVNSNTNFVSVNHGDAVVQVAFNVPFPTPNGIGGVTLLGRVQNMEVTTDKKGSVNIRMNVVGIGISAQVFINMYARTNRASVDIIPNFNSRRLTLRGTLMPIKKSSVYQGWGI